ncbi:MAG: type II toxin-antitoxin system mRNA interferase toxin, RelE/StbE family [bacterium]|nr:type II toxin-antitoxin system mRNA interferase toxin, RelE/StbE family [bacterium]
MKARFHHNFRRQYQKLRVGEQKRFKERRNLFLADPYHPLLNNHPLRGKYEGYRSINIGGDLRAIYKRLDQNTVLFAEIGPHHALYS